MRLLDIQKKMIEIDIRDAAEAGKPTAELEKLLSDFPEYERYATRLGRIQCVYLLGMLSGVGLVLLDINSFCNTLAVILFVFGLALLIYDRFLFLTTGIENRYDRYTYYGRMIWRKPKLAKRAKNELKKGQLD